MPCFKQHIKMIVIFPDEGKSWLKIKPTNKTRKSIVGLNSWIFK